MQEGDGVDIRVLVEEERYKEEGDEDGEEGVCVDVEFNLHCGRVGVNEFEGTGNWGWGGGGLYTCTTYILLRYTWY